MPIYEVKREHFGEKQYHRGDLREANEIDVKHLIEKGVLVERKAPKQIDIATVQPKKKRGQK